MSSDGIFFHPFREGQPGIQPERLGPYTTTLNPGYDPGLPLYRPWPLFTALAAAYGESGEEQEPVPPSTAAAGVAAATGSATGVAGSPIAAGSVGSTVGVVNSATAAGRQHESAIRLVSADGEGLDTLLRNLGASLAAGPSDHIIIDGIHLPDSATLAHVLATAGSGSSILIWGLRPSGVPVLNQVLPEKVTVTDRKATSYIPMQPDGLLQGLGNPAWYFSELTRRPVSEYAMTGDIVQKGKILLAACNTDWQRWNGRPEYSKTAAVIRSEREAKPAGSVLVEYVVGRGRIYLLSIDPDMQVSKTVIRQLLVNWGAQLTDSAGLSHSSISGHRYSAFDDRGVWHVQAASRLNFWLYSPRSLVNLLVEPDLPTLNMQVSGSDEWQLRVNGKVAVHSSRPEALPLQKGWNHLVLEIRHPNNQPLTVQLTSTVPAFLSTLRSAVNAPDTESISNDDAHE
jgi:beta-galactosidase